MSKRDDVSVLRPSIQLSGDGVTGILNAMKVGTAEIKDALLHQCSIIYECKVCQNLFRGIANFLAHKRVYCQTQFCESKLPFVETKDEHETVIVQPKPPPEKKEKEKPEWDDYVTSDEEAEPQKKEPRMSVFEQMKKGIFRGTSESYDFYTKAVERQNRKDEKRKQMTMTLDNIPGNSTAVKQKLDGEDVMIIEPKEPKGRGRPKKRKKMEDDEEETKVVKIKREAEDDEEEVVVVEPKAATGHIRMNLRQRGANGSTMYEQLKGRPDCDVKALECLKCKQTYATVKTLHFHMTSQHEVGGRRTFYPCPLCSAVYAQVWSTTRHIAKAHGHTQQQARAMVHQIRKNAFHKSLGEVRVATTYFGSGTTEKKPSAGSTTASKSNSNGEEFGLDFVIHRCKGCNKLFERKDSHDRHARMCAQAKAVERESTEVKLETNNNTAGTSAAVASTLSQLNNSSEFTVEEMRSIMEIIDESTHQCLKCYRMFGTTSNLHRHAIRHLGWRRFKCQFCRFLSYNKSECRRHLRVVHQKAIDKAGLGSALNLDNFIDKIEASDIEASPKSNLPRVEMKTMGANRGSPRKTRGATRAAAATDTLVTRSGMYNKPNFKHLSKGRGSKDGNEDSDSNTSDTSIESSKAEDPQDEDEIKEDEDDIMQVKQDVTSSRSRRKGQTPQRSSGTNSPHPPGENTPATARPASHILSQSPAKSNPTTVIATTPTKNNTASPGKSPMVNILSKSVPKFSISGGVTTVLLPVFTQCVQVQSGGQTGSKWIRPTTAPPLPQPPQQPLQAQPHIRVLGPNFQLPGSSGSAQVRTVAVSTFPTSGTFTVTETNTLANRPIVVSSSSTSAPIPVKLTIAGSGKSTVLATSGTNAAGMPVLCPMRPISVSSVDTSVPVSNPDTVTVSLDSTCQLSPAMPSLAPIATHTMITESAQVTQHTITPRRSLTPQPVRVVQELDIKPRSFTPNLPISLDEPQITIENLTAENAAESDITIQSVTVLPKVDSSSNISLVTDVTGTEEVLSSNGQATGEELITISTESSCSSFPQTNPVEGDDYVVSVTPVSEYLMEKQEQNDVPEDEFVTVTTTAGGAEPAQVDAMDSTEGADLLTMIDSTAATDPMQYINQ